jgi:hypothetical protein
LRKLSTVCLVWATAASTLVASTPHVLCCCASGKLKTIYLPPDAGKALRCCQGSCGSPDTGETFERKAGPGDKGCCRSKSDKSTANRGHDNTRLGDEKPSPSLVKMDCQKALVQMGGSALNCPETKLAQSLSALLYNSAETACASPALPTTQHTALRPIDRQPGSPDLITSLGRLVI